MRAEISPPPAPVATTYPPPPCPPSCPSLPASPTISATSATASASPVPTPVPHGTNGAGWLIVFLFGLIIAAGAGAPLVLAIRAWLRRRRPGGNHG